MYRTDRLYLRPFNETDIKEPYLSWFHDQEVTKYNSHGLFPYTKQQARAFFEKLDSSNDLIWAVFILPKSIKAAKNPMKHIGNISLQNINWINRSAEFACVFGAKEHWGKGYATEAAQIIFLHGFNKLNLHRIWTGTAETNIGMQNVAKKLGMNKEGQFKDAMFLEGEWTDIVEYGITEDDFFKWFFYGTESHTPETDAVGQIEEIRKTNNVNWMQILRIALKEAPGQTKGVLKEISKCDALINDALQKLAEI